MGWGNRMSIALAGALMMLATGGAPAPAATGDVTIGNGTIQLGVTHDGTLGIRGSCGMATGVGVRLVSAGFPAGEGVCYGSDVEGWGAADVTSGVMGFVNEDTAAPTITSLPVVSDAATADTVTTIGATLSVAQHFAPSAQTPNVYTGVVTVKNTSAAPVDLRYRRIVDWDVPPTQWNERMTTGGTAPASLLAGGVANTDSLSPAASWYSPLAAIPVGGLLVSYPALAADNGPSDQGSLYDLALGAVPAGQCISFTFYWGAAATFAEAQTAITAAGAAVWSLAENNNRSEERRVGKECRL